MEEFGKVSPQEEQRRPASKLWFSPIGVFNAVKEVRLYLREINEEARVHRFARLNGLPLGECRGAATGQISVSPSAESALGTLAEAELNIRDGLAPGHGISPGRLNDPNCP